MSGVVTLLAAATLLAQSGAAANYSRQLVFSAVAGESWDYMGSRRMLFDMSNGTSATAGLRLDLIDQVRVMKGFVGLCGLWGFVGVMWGYERVCGLWGYVMWGYAKWGYVMWGYGEIWGGMGAGGQGSGSAAKASYGGQHQRGSRRYSSTLCGRPRQPDNAEGLELPSP